MLYWQSIGICHPSTVKYFDECAVVAKRPRGQQVTITVPNPEKYRISVNGITSVDSASPSVMWNLCNGTTSRSCFFSWVCSLPLLPCGLVLLR